MSIKRIAVLMLALCLAFVLAACGGSNTCESHVDANTDGKCDNCGTEVKINDDNQNNEDDGTKTYTVYVKNDSGEFVSGVELQIFEGSTPKGSDTTDANGAASVSFKPVGKVVKVMLSVVPDGYVLPDDYVAEFEDGQNEVTVTLETSAPKATYTVYVNDVAGAPVQNVLVQICQGNVCFTGQFTDADGAAKFEFIPNGEELKVQISDAPEGYIYTNDYIATFEEGQTEITVIIESTPGGNEDIGGDNGGNTGNEEEEEKTLYTINVKNEDGETLSGVTVGFYDGETLIGEATSDANGVITYEIKSTIAVTVKVISVPKGYDVNTDVFDFTSGEDISISIKRSGQSILPVHPFS